MTKDEVFLNIANELGKLSTCDRAAIGAVVTHEGRCVCWGYNGAPPGLPHCDENHHGWQYSKEEPLRGIPPEFIQEVVQQEGAVIDPDEWIPLRAAEVFGCRNSIHAEANALSFAARQGISTDKGTLYVSQSPCLDCSRLTIAAGIVRVRYGTMYRDTSGIELLRTAGVEIELLEPA